MYFNRLTHMYVKEKDATAPPEYYTEVTCSVTDNFIETWVTGYNQELSIAYADDTLKNQLVDSLRESMTETNGIKLLWLRRISLPKEYYDILEKEVKN